MNAITIRFYAQLNDFLPLARQQRPFTHFFCGSPAVKDVIESLGIPHPEVALILVDGSPVGFPALLLGGEKVSVYPVFQHLDIPPSILVGPQSPVFMRFVLDAHLGKLASYLRMLGFDAVYCNDLDDGQLVALAATGQRIMLSQDRDLLKRKQLTYGYCPRAKDPVRQLIEVLNRYRLYSHIVPFTRCLLCNGELIPVAAETVWDLLPPRVKSHYSQFHRCRGCGKVYWPGTHHRRMAAFISDIRQELAEIIPGDDLAAADRTN